MATVELKVVDEFGVPYTTIDTMTSITPLVDILNTGGNMRFGLHALDPQVGALAAVEREVQVWRNGTFLAGGGWLVVVKPTHELNRANTTVEFECRGLLWWFDRRFIGDADRLNYLGNGGFEDVDFGPWGATGTTESLEVGRKFTGNQSAKLVNGTAGTDSYLGQTVYITTGPLGALMTLAGWFWVDSAGWVGEAFGNRGLFAQYAVGGVLKDFRFATLNVGGQVPKDGWHRRRVTIQLPPNVTSEVQIRLYSPGGTICWDELVLVAMDSLSFYDIDLATIADAISVHLQDPVYGKSDLNIGRSTPPTGILATRHYQHADHHPGGASLTELTEMAGGFDHSIETTTTTRTYTTHAGGKGEVRPALAWEEITSVNFIPVDGNEAASSVVILGEGDGPDREEGSFLDLARFGGRVLEAVLPAQGSPIQALDQRAAEQGRMRASAGRLAVTLAPGLRVGTLVTGDTVAGPATPYGSTDLSGSWRVINAAWEPIRDQVSFIAEAA